jgi:DNA-3-methyladenine glycosylase II
VLPQHLKTDIDHLLQTDKVFSKSGLTLKDFVWKKERQIFPSLIQTIVGQQLSTKAAITIWGRVTTQVGEDLSPPRFAEISDDAYRACGLSRQKISYLRGLVEATMQGDFKPDGLKKLTDDDVVQSITSLKGFGVWSAHMFLMFTLERPDIWPSGDLGIREGVRLYKKLEERPDVPATEKFGQKFKGRRTSAALILWRIKDSI